MSGTCEPATAVSIRAVPPAFPGDGTTRCVAAMRLRLGLVQPFPLQVTLACLRLHHMLGLRYVQKWHRGWA